MLEAGVVAHAGEELIRKRLSSQGVVELLQTTVLHAVNTARRTESLEELFVTSLVVCELSHGAPGGHRARTADHLAELRDSHATRYSLRHVHQTLRSSSLRSSKTRAPRTAGDETRNSKRTDLGIDEHVRSHATVRVRHLRVRDESADDALLSVG